MTQEEIPFGAFDSELMHQEINIPKGFEATIEGNKVILKKTESEDEKIRKELIEHCRNTRCVTEEGAERIAKWITWLEKQEGCEYIKKEWLEHIKQSWYKEGFIDGKYTPKELAINDATTLNGLIDFLENGTAKLQHDLTLYANWLKKQFSPNEKQGEQKNEDMTEALRTEYEKGRADVIQATEQWLANSWPKYCENPNIIKAFKENVIED